MSNRLDDVLEVDLASLTNPQDSRVTLDKAARDAENLGASIVSETM
jgi:hypothetical protein